MHTYSIWSRNVKYKPSRVSSNNCDGGAKKKKKATAAFLLNTARCVLLCAFVADSFVAVKEKSADVPVPVCQFYYIPYGSLQMATTLPAIHITVTTVATVIFAGQYDTA